VIAPLRQEPPGRHSPAARLGEVVRAVGGPAPLGQGAHLRVLARLRAEASGAGTRRPGPRGRWARPALAATLAVALLLLAIGAKAGLSWMRRAGLLGEAQAEKVIEPRHARAGSRIRGPRLPASPDMGDPQPGEPEIPAPEEPVGAAGETAAGGVGSARTAPRPPVRHVRSESNPAGAGRAAHDPVPSSPLAQESRLLARALDQLRGARDYAGALATLNEYDARFPAGLLRSEATLARLDALVAVGNSTAALALLDGAAIRGPRALELLVLRGELRAAAGRQREAIADFDRVLGQTAPTSLRKRAFYGRASLRARIGDVAGAAGDLDQSGSRPPTSPR